MSKAFNELNNKTSGGSHFYFQSNNFGYLLTLVGIMAAWHLVKVSETPSYKVAEKDGDIEVRQLAKVCCFNQ